MSKPKRAVLIMIDGMRPDGLQAAKTPAIDSLIARGAHTLSARTVMPSITLPCHTSLFFSVEPERHGITTNTWHPFARPVPGLIDVLKQALRRKTAMFYNWGELRDMVSPSFLDVSHMFHYDGMPGDESDQLNFERAAEWLGGNDFAFTFLYYGMVDMTGHKNGWMSPEYISRIEDADRAVAKVLKTIPEDTLIVLLADHGGHGKTHGTEMAEDMTIPVIMAGPGVPKGVKIERAVSIMDIAPTITTMLELGVPKDWTGNPITF